MAHRTPTDAFRHFRLSVQDSIACFAHSRVTGTTHRADERGQLTLNYGKPLELNSNTRKIEIECVIGYRIEKVVVGSGWQVSTLGYIHSVTVDDEPIVEFHWHPDDTSNIWYPHIHPRLAGGGRHRGGMHIPSGHVFVEDVLIFAHERGAVPLKDDWTTITANAKQRLTVRASRGAAISERIRPEG